METDPPLQTPSASLPSPALPDDNMESDVKLPSSAAAAASPCLPSPSTRNVHLPETHDTAGTSIKSQQPDPDSSETQTTTANEATSSLLELEVKFMVAVSENISPVINSSTSYKNSLRLMITRAILTLTDENLRVTIENKRAEENQETEMKAILTFSNDDNEMGKTISATIPPSIPIQKVYGWSDILFHAFLFLGVASYGVTGVHRMMQDILEPKKGLQEVDGGLWLFLLSSFSFLLYRVYKLDCGSQTALLRRNHGWNMISA